LEKCIKYEYIVEHSMIQIKDKQTEML